MTRTSDFISNVAAIFSHSYLAVPTPVPVSLSPASLPDLRPSSSQSSTSSTGSISTTSSKRSKLSMKFSEKMKLHNDVWWTATSQPRSGRQVVLHEWNYMYI